MRIRLIFILLTLFITRISFSQVVINEICASNGDINYDPQFFQFPSWVELFNSGSSQVDLSGYYLSDSLSLPQRWTIPAGTVIPAHGYLLIWCDKQNSGLHTNFSLDPDGESVILSKPAGVVADQISFSAQMVNTSYGRMTDGNATWRQASKPSPLNANIPGPINGPTSAPVFSMTSGRYAGGITVSITAAPGADIRYTTDGTPPRWNSQQYTGPVSVTATMVLKARAFHNDYLPSLFTSATYFINEHAFTLPVVSISTDPRYLFNDTIGIYVEGVNGVIGNCSTIPVNWNMNWDRHAVFEYLSASGVRNFEQDLDIRLAGNCTRRYSQKSFAIQASKKYGIGKLNYPFFNQKKNISQYENFFLRNSGNDNGACLFRDAFMQYLPQGYMDIDYLAYEPTIFYLNGQYWGIQDLREKIDADYIEENYGIPANDVDIIYRNSLADEGTTDQWYNYLNTLESMNPNDPATFSYVQQRIDVQEYINWLVVNTYSANYDWPANDRAWHQRSTNGKWRWILWDLDFGFGRFPDQADYNHLTLDFINDPVNNKTFTRPIRAHMAVPEFKKLFIATLASSLTTIFEPTRVNAVIDQFSARLEAEIPYHKTRWGGTKDAWDAEVQRVREFAVRRNEFMKTYMTSYYGLGAIIQIATEPSPLGSGAVEINGTKTDGKSFSTFFADYPYVAKAVAKDGYIFRDWTVSTRTLNQTQIINTGDVWKYWDSGNISDLTWKNNGYNDGLWKSGSSQLGYGDGDETTIVGFGPSSSNKYITTYFRKTFSITDTSKVNTLSGSVLYDDGAVVYVNGFEVFRGNLPSGTITGSTLTPGSVANELWFNPFEVARKYLRNGTNTISVEVHQVNATSSDISFDLRATLNTFTEISNNTINTATISGIASQSMLLKANFVIATPITGLVINEISASSNRALDDFNEREDWIEIYNASNSQISLSGLFISDDIGQKAKYRIPQSELLNIAAGSYKILWADADQVQGVSHLPFKLSKSGESIFITQIIGKDTLVLATLTFPAQLDGYSFARIPDRTGSFTTTSSPTPGTPNLSSVIIQGLVINEFSASRTGIKDSFGDYEDWIELYNNSNVPISLDPLFITDTLGRRAKHQLYDSIPLVIQPGAYKLLWADNEVAEGSDHLSFKLGSSGEAIGIYQLIGTDTVALTTLNYPAQVDGYSYARIPNRTGSFTTTSKPTPGVTNLASVLTQGLVINEFSASRSMVLDSFGEPSDWIELFNNSNSPISLNPLFITDTLGRRSKHPLFNDSIPLIIQPGGYKVLWADDEVVQGPDHLGFKLGASGEAIGIYQLIGTDTVAVTTLSYGSQLDGFVQSRIPNATGSFVNNSNVTPAASNQLPTVIQGLVINEINTGKSSSVDEYGDRDDWIELFNYGNQPISLKNLFVTDSLPDPLKHYLYNDSVDMIIPPGGYKVLWADNESFEGVNHLDFKLSSSGEAFGIFQLVGNEIVALATTEFPEQPKGFSTARIPNGIGPFLNTPTITPGAPNTQPALVSGLVINEFSAVSGFATDGYGEHDDWVELYNAGSTPINLGWLFISDSLNHKLKHPLYNDSLPIIIPPGGYQVLWSDNQPEQGFDHLGFKLSSSGESIGIFQFVGADTVEVTSMKYEEQLGGFAYARIPNVTGQFEFTYAGTPGHGNQRIPLVSGLTINEIGSSKSEKAVDEFGEQDDWVEIFNSSNDPIDISGLFISDDTGNQLKHLISDDFRNWTLAPGAYQIFWADEQTIQGRNHLPFKLSAGGESIHLYQLTAGVITEISGVNFPSMSEGYSYARLPDGYGPFRITQNLTPGNQNVEVTGLEYDRIGSDQIIAYPNPVSHELKIRLNEGDRNFEIFDTVGQMLASIKITEPGELIVNTNELNDGIYLIRLSSEDRSRSKKIIVLHQ